MTESLIQVRNFVIQKIKESKYLDDWFYKDHILEVEKQACWLCEIYPEANQEVVLLSVWLHDIGRIEKGMDDGHEGYAYAKALELMPQYGYNEEITLLVAKSCQTHRAEGGLIPESIEAKILATADALSHFYNLIYLKVFEHYRENKSFKEAVEILKKKIERDFNKKLFFPEAKEKVHNYYKSWNKILRSY